MPKGNYTVTFTYVDADLEDVLHTAEDVYKNGDTTPESYQVHDDSKGRVIQTDRIDYKGDDTDDSDDD